MTDVLKALMELPSTVVVLGTGAALGVIGFSAALVIGTRQKVFQKRLDERLTHLTTALSLLTNTTEEGLRAAALEIARISRPGASEAQPQATARERIASAAGHGRSIQDIAASEQVSEGEVLLHLLMHRLQPEGSSADVC